MTATVVQNAYLQSLCAFIPHKKNKYRPYALRHPVLAALSLVLVFMKVATFTLLVLTPETAYLSTITSAYLVDQTNSARRAAGLPALVTNSLLQTSARKKAEDMLKNGYFAHNSPAGVTPWQWFDEAGYGYVYAGENLAIDFTTGEAVHKAWMNSPGHRQNIVNSRYRDIGIAVVTGKFQERTTTVIVQHFGSLSAAVAESKPQTIKATPNPTAEAAKPQPRQNLAEEPKAITTTPLPAPEILEPTEGQILPSGAATVRGKSVDESTVELNLEGKKVGTYLTKEGFFSGKFTVPSDQNKDAELSALARLESVSSEPSPVRHIKIDARVPEINSDGAMFLPDPNGDVSSLLLVLPVFGAIKKANAVINNQIIPLTFKGTLATGKISATESLNNIAVQAEDANGRVKTAAIYPLQRYQISQRTATEKFAEIKIANFSAKTRDISVVLVYVLAFLLAINIFIHIRIQHPDLIVHTLVVMALGTLLFIVT